MFNRKFMMLAILLVGLLAISAVSAEDNATADVASEGMDESVDLSSVDQSVMDSVQDDDLGVVSSDFNSGEEVLAEVPRVPNNFTYIENLIDPPLKPHSPNRAISLSGYFVPDASYNQPITFSSIYGYVRNITINGNGLTLDAKGICGIVQNGNINLYLNNITFLNSGNDEIFPAFTGDPNTSAVTGEGNLTVRDCTFMNCYSSIRGGAINWLGNCSFINCNFVNCSSYGYGGAIYNEGNCSFFNCSFVDCYSQGDGGAIYCSGNANIINCSFGNCSTGSEGTAIYKGGAISCSGSGNFSKCVISNCTFRKCLATDDGGAINLYYSNTSIFDCSFVDCHSDDGGGAINSWGSNDNVSNCSFAYCTAGSGGTMFYKGGAIYVYDGNYSLSDCSFVNCSSTNGGAIFSDYDYFDLENGEKFKFVVSNSSFLACSAEEYGGGIYFTYNESEMFNCYFKDNTAKNGSDWYSEYDIENVITMVSTSIAASKVTATYGVSKKLTITLKDAYDNALDSKSVTVNVGTKSKTLTTDDKGQASLVVSTLVPKTYVATVKFEGDDKYKESSTTADVKVNKANPKLTAKAKSFKRSVKTKKYTVTLKTNKNKVMKNTKVTIKVNKKTYTAKTNSKGVATFKITKLTKKGKYTATVKYAGSKYYNAKSAKVKITVK